MDTRLLRVREVPGDPRSLSRSARTLPGEAGADMRLWRMSVAPRISG